MRRIYLIRHGLPYFPGGGSYCIGQADFPLDPLGEEQARRMAEKLGGERLTVFSSPLKRAYDTARATVILSYICHVMGEETYKSLAWRPAYCGWYELELDEGGMRCIFPWQGADRSENEN